MPMPPKAAMPTRKKINLAKVLSSLNVTCPHCGASLAPNERQRLDNDRLRCLKCGKAFGPSSNVGETF